MSEKRAIATKYFELTAELDAARAELTLAALARVNELTLQLDEVRSFLRAVS